MNQDDKNKKPPLYIFLHIPKTGGTTFGKHLLDGLKRETVIKIYSLPETGPVGNLEKLEETINLLLSGKESQDQIQAIYGHGIYLGIEKLFPDREIRYVTFLRKPLNRAVSHYNFYRQKLERGIRDKVITDLLEGEKGILSFEEAFLRNNILHNYTFKFLADHIFNTDFADNPQNSYPEENTNRKILAEIKVALNKFYFIGVTENSEDNFLYLYHLLGIKNFFANQRRSKIFFNLTNISKEFKSLLQSENQLDQDLYQWAVKLNDDFKKSHPEFHRIVLLMKIRRFFYLPRFYLTSLKILAYEKSAAMKKKSEIYAKLISRLKNLI